MSGSRMRPLPPVDLADPAAVSAWVLQVETKLESMRPLIVDATTRKVHRIHGRRHIRRSLTRSLRDLTVMLVALNGAVASPTQPPLSP